MNAKIYFWAGAALGLAALISGCSSSKKDSGPPASTSTAALCTPDPALLAAKRDCRADDQCPCGAHCTLGQCSAECSAAQPCADGSVCDTFGRCRIASDSSRIPKVIASGSDSKVTIESANVLVPASGSAPFRFHPTTSDLGPIRVTVSAGFEVQCSAKGKFGTECDDPSLTAGTERTLSVRLAASADEGAIGTLLVFSEGQVVSAALRGASTPASAALGSGLYAGSASLVDLGVSDTTASTTKGTSPQVTRELGFSFPISARIFSGDQSVIFDLVDPLHGLNQKGEWVGQLTMSDAVHGSLNLPRTAVDSAPLTATMKAEILAEVSNAAVTVSASGASLTATVGIDYTGVLPSGHAPHATWNIALTRSGDLPAGASAPAIPPDVNPTLPKGATDQASDWSQSAVSLFPSDLGDTDAEQQLLIDTWKATDGTSSTPRRLDACTPLGRSAGAKLLSADEWPTATLAPPNPIAPAAIDSSQTTGRNALLGSLISAVTGKYVAYASAAVPAASPDDPSPINVDDGAIPCALTFPGAVLYCYDGSTDSSVLQFAALDRCAEISKELNCNVEAGTGSMDLQVQLSTTNDLETLPCVQDQTTVTALTATVTKVCKLPTVAWNCGELVSCVDKDGVSSSSPGSTPLPVGADLNCGIGTGSLATLADANRNQSGNTDTVTTVVENTLADLARLRRPATAPFPVAADLDTARLVVALEYATQIDRERAEGSTAPPSAGATRYANRLFQQWLGAHAAIASEATERSAVPDVVQGTDPDPDFPSPSDALSTALDGWALLLHPRFAAAISAMDGSVLGTPDYRADWLAKVPADTGEGLADGLPVAMLDTLRAEVLLLDQLLFTASLAGDTKVLVLAGRTIRDAIVVQALARDLYGRVTAAAPKAKWLAKYQTSEQALNAALGKALAHAESLELGKNPLGIEDEDLPLYFSGTSIDPSGRFSAISDYLLGASSATSSTAWAPSAVAAAQTAADALKDAYQANVERQYRAALSTTDSQNRIDAIKTQYGTAISGLCGLPDGVTAATALDTWTDFDANRCYYASEDPNCSVDQSQVDALLDEPTVLYQFCLAKTIAEGSSSARYRDDGLNAALTAVLADGTIQCSYGNGSCAEAPSGPTGCIQCGAVQTNPVTVAQLSSFDLSDVSADTLQAAQASCRAEQPSARQNLPTAEDGPSSPLAQPECYRGSIGDLAFSLRGAAKDVDIARSTLQDHIDAYDIEIKNCLIKQGANAQTDALGATHDQSMTDLRAAKSGYDQMSAIMQGVYNCASITVSAVGADNPFAAVAGGLSAAAGCGAAIVQSMDQVASIQIQAKMDQLDQDYQDMVSSVQEQEDVSICYNEAHQELVGMRTAQQQIDRASIDFAHAQYSMNGSISDAATAYNDGQAAVATAVGRTVRPPALDSWFDARVATFSRTMSQARLASYLAERAVEYEFQASLADRATILNAATPDDLSSALSDLRNTSGTLGINGHRPSQLKVVVSMRDHVLQLADTSKAPAGEQALSTSDRLKLLLRDPRYSVYAAGAYAGQSIPFSIAPLGALNGDTKGIEIFATTDCAERIWSVNASIIGAGQLVRGTQTSFARMDLLKSNTFFSQSCSASQGASPFQTASVRPSRNLFRDPEFGLSGPSTTVTSDPTVPDEVALMSRARIQAYFNVSRETMEDDMYANGETSELAARGLYGDYALFFPAGILSLPQYDNQGAVTGYSDGLDLDAIDDILLRIDYVSVAR